MGSDWIAAHGPASPKTLSKVARRELLEAADEASTHVRHVPNIMLRAAADLRLHGRDTLMVHHDKVGGASQFFYPASPKEVAH